MTQANADRAARAFRSLRWCLVRNNVRCLLTSSRLRLSMVLLCSAVFWVLLFGLFFSGFRFLASFMDATNEVVEYIFGLFFLSLLVMLVFSTGIILYASVFTRRESDYLLTLPAPDDHVFAYKFVEALAFSSWGFMLLGSPMMVAYGITVGAGWPFYALFLAYLVGFVLGAGGLGSMAAIVVANYLPRRPKTVLAVVAGGLLLAGAGAAARALSAPGEPLTRDWLDGLLSRLTFSQHPLLPSRWMSRGLVGSARGDLEEARFYLMVTWANAAAAYLVAAVMARDLLRQGYSRAQGGRSNRRRIGFYGLDSLFHRGFRFIPSPVRLLILKDLRSFRRDPAQWSQFLIFFGLLAFYFLNIRRLGYQNQSPHWRYLLSFLNLAVTALLLSTFTTRFIFPLLSLEGRNLWILGLLPLKRSSILWGKFAFAAGISLVATEALVTLSDLMLKLPATVVLMHEAVVAVLCFGLSGISVGLGARLPNLREDDPSKIAAGFGGTLNLLVSLLFIGSVVVALVLPFRYTISSETLNGLDAGHLKHSVSHGLWISSAVILVLGALATYIPLRMGIRAFDRMEF